MGSQEADYIQSQWEVILKRNNDGMIVELNWGIAPLFFSFPLAPGVLWKRLRSVPFAGSPVLQLAPEHLLLVLCAHGTKHLWGRLSWICDISELIRAHPELDWREIMRHARSLGAERMLFLGLFLAGHLLGANIPEEVSQRMKSDRRVKSLAAQVMNWLLQESEPPSETLSGSLFHLRSRERLQDKIQYCLHFAITPTFGDWSLLPLPSHLSFVYYLLRPLRLVEKQGEAALRRLFGS
jgi:hypothetical protein